MSIFLKSPAASLLDILAKGGLGYTITKIPITNGSRPIRRQVQKVLLKKPVVLKRKSRRRKTRRRKNKRRSH